ncbi:glutathione S-transferase [Photobacterium galatheae]|uniref:glutathione S-transferase family protein n=1 Tax=Photobacterium galatheae TaxID=1654360 RepID=UPI00202CC875|nr:glutathione S-transferase [Photobacterium galatheae]MCM0148773.1 glutathione S-transferase [Photobacterium galatheae]
MIQLHHLNKSRSKRIIWLLEELGVDYEVISYQRDRVTFLAPPELKTVHPLGKSPVIEDDGLVVTESGAITEYLIEKYGEGRLAPQRGSQAYVSYLQWIHFAESSAILPLLLKMFVEKDGCETNFLAGYAEGEIAKVMSYFDQSLAGKKYLVEDKLSGADIMMSFIVEILQTNNALMKFPNIASYAQQLASHPAYLKSNDIEAAYDL